MNIRIAANISHLFSELPFLDRFDAAAEAGFDGVEALFPYEEPAPEVKQALLRNGLSMVLINAPPPNYTGGLRGYGAMPDRVERFRYDMRRAFRYADSMQVAGIHVMAGDGSGLEAHETFVSNLKWAAAEAPPQLTLTIEPLNKVAMPGYFLNGYAQAADILAQVGADNLALQYDSYHAQMITGDAVATFREFAALTRHIQIGDAPNRTAPGTGEIDFTGLFEAIKDRGYKGWVAAEYGSEGQTKSTGPWMEKLRAALK